MIVLDSTPRRVQIRRTPIAPLLTPPADPAISTPSEDVTELLRSWSDGDAGALDRLVPLVYDHLRAIARQRLRHEDWSPSLDTTALVHETYIKLVGLRRVRLRDRAHFLALASRLMRRLLVDHARARTAGKRGGRAPEVDLEDELLTDDQAESITDLHEALERLAEVDPRQSRILELRYFGGLSLEETAEAVGISLATVKRELRFARAWLAAELDGDPVARFDTVVGGGDDEG